MRILFTVSVLLIPFWLFSQKVQNVRTTVVDSRVTITYELSGTLPGDTLFISVFPFDPAVEMPARGITGDIGKVYAGNGEKKIEWTTKDINILTNPEPKFDVRSELVYRFVVTSEIESVRRGKKVSVRWTAWPDRPITIQLVNDTTAQYTVASRATKGEFIWKVPQGLAIDDDYRLRLRNSSQILETGQFKIKHTIPTAVKFLPLVAVGIFFLPKETPKKSDLPAPPGIGLN